MSGGHFRYKQYEIGYIADEIEEVILKNNDETLDEYGSKSGHFFPPEVIVRFKEAYNTLRKAQIMAQRVDWLLSCDDGPDNFVERWEKELSEYKELR